MEEISVYLKNLDISVLSKNRPTLLLVHSQLLPFFNELATQKATTDKIQEILKLSDGKMLQNHTIKVKRLIFNSYGSKVLEIFVDKDVFASLESFVRNNLKTCLNDENATFVVRKMIGRGFRVILNVSDIDFEKESVLNTILAYLADGEKMSKLHDEVSNSSSYDDPGNSSSENLQIQSARVAITDQIIKTLFDVEKLTAKKYSFFFENFVRTLSNENISKVYKKIKRELNFLMENSYSNFMMQSFIEKYEDTEKLLKKVSLNNVHENVIFKILTKLQKDSKNDKLVEKIITKHYKDLKAFLFINDCVNVRALPVVKRLFIIKEHNMSINKVFSENFNKNSFKGDVECARYYLMGNENAQEKEKFVQKMMNECLGKKGEKVLEWMSRCCGYESRGKILKLLKNRKRVKVN